MIDDMSRHIGSELQRLRESRGLSSFFGASEVGRAAGPRALVGQLIAHRSWSAETLREYQRRRLADLIGHAVTLSPYYRQVLGSAAVSAPLKSLPTLPKATMMQRFNDIVTDRSLRLADLREHLAGPTATAAYRDHVVVSTSGSTGEPALFVYSPAEMAEAVAGLMRAMMVVGIAPDARLVGIGAPTQVSLSHHLLRGVAAGRASDAPRVSVQTPIADLVHELNAYQPDVVATVAGLAALLAEEQLAGRLHIALCAIICTSEVLAPDMRERIHAAWGVHPDELYSSTEAGVMASSSPSRVGLHIWEDQVILEVVDETGHPAPPGTPGHKVLLTNLLNRVQPLIRYEISDAVTLAGGVDPTGWPFRRIAAIDGRSDDVLMLSTPDGTKVPVHAMQLRAPFVDFPDVVQYQIVQDHSGLTVSVVLRPGANPGLEYLLRQALAGRLITAGVLPPPIAVIRVVRIDPDSGPLRKYAVVKSLLPKQ
jgi:phenylacetate-CoA ligase